MENCRTASYKRWALMISLVFNLAAREGGTQEISTETAIEAPSDESLGLDSQSISPDLQSLI